MGDIDEPCCLSDPPGTSRTYCLDCARFDWVCTPQDDHHLLGCTCASIDDCAAAECLACGVLACGEPTHYHHDGCPSCDVNETEDISL